jgi:hypothetical protein
MPTKPATLPSPGPKPPPPGWGEDELTRFLEHARQNQHATFANKRDAVAKLMDIDALFAKVTKVGWLNPKSEVAAMLFLRCIGAYRAACGLAMAGQAADCYVQCRSVLEYAGYAVHVDRNPALARVWLDRHEHDAGMKASKRAFQHVTVVESVRAANQHAAVRFEAIYQRTIDFGGHPNERAVTANMNMTEQPDRLEVLAILLHKDGLQLDMALKTTAQCGMIALELFETIYGPKFVLLGIKDAMLALRRTGL